MREIDTRRLDGVQRLDTELVAAVNPWMDDDLGYRQHLGLEQNAAGITAIGLTAVPTLVQAYGYAEHLGKQVGAERGMETQEITKRLDVTLDRSVVLRELGASALVVVPERVLRSPSYAYNMPPARRAKQVEYLCGLVQVMGVDVRIVPAEAHIPTRLPAAALTRIEAADGSSVVSVTNRQYREGMPVVASDAPAYQGLSDQMDAITNQALSANESLKYMRLVRADLDDEARHVRVAKRLAQIPVRGVASVQFSGEFGLARPPH
jgi:hypothetical protein